MSAEHVLAISSSRVGNSEYLEQAVPMINRFLGSGTFKVAFIPFASVDSYDHYLQKVQVGLNSPSYDMKVANPENAKDIIAQSDVIMVGGGNTFKLIHDLYLYDLVDLIQKKVSTGTPYIGWSAGANITGKTIGTTNDMPIIEPKTFTALNFLPFQINPHYINVKPEGFNGETRDQRLEEFIKINPAVKIVGLPEGTALVLQNKKLQFIGECDGVVFENDFTSSITVRHQIKVNDDLSWLL